MFHKTCKYCNKPFDIKHRKQECCSLRCAYWLREQRGYRPNIFQKECVICGGRFTSTSALHKMCLECRAKKKCLACGKQLRPKHIFIVKYCSLACANQHLVRKTTRGRPNPASRGKSEHIGRHWLEGEEWKKKVYERDNYTCQHCQRTGLRLHAHHIVPWNEDKSKRFDVANGLTLCASCHSKHHWALDKAVGNTRFKTKTPTAQSHTP